MVEVVAAGADGGFSPVRGRLGGCALLGLRSFLLWLVIVVPLVGVSQTDTNVPPPQDPMMTLMLSQPKMDVNAPVYAEASFDPPVVQPGGRTIYRLSFNALRDAISWNGKLPNSKLGLRAGAVGQTMQMAGTNFQPRTAFNFRLRPWREGRHVVPSFTVTVGGKQVRVPEAAVLVSSSHQPVPPQMLYLEVEPERPFVGEAARVRIYSPASASGIVQALGQVQLVGQGFFQELTANRQSVETRSFQGRMVPSFVYETTFTPIAAGKHDVFAQAFAVGNRFSGTIVISGPAMISGSALQYTLLDSDPVELFFRPLPPEGRPPGFSGAVGSFSIDPPQLSTNAVSPGEPVKMTVSIRGRGNMGRLALPDPPTLPDWQVLPARRETLPAQVVEARGYASFTYTLVPLKTGPQTTPELPFSFFDPDREIYVARNIPPVAITVLPGQLPADLDQILKERLEKGPPEPALSALAAVEGRSVATLVPLQFRAWFPGVQLAPLLFFVGLWQWDRRKRFLEKHPDIVLRRQARRELKSIRRKLAKAARTGNASAFLDLAVRGVQVAAAPHYPAHPGAILSTDVMGLLQPEASASTLRAVQRLFETSNAERYAGAASDGLMTEHENIRRALDILEAKL